MDQLYNTSVTLPDFVYSVSHAPVQREAATRVQQHSAVKWAPSRHDMQKKVSRGGRYLRMPYVSSGRRRTRGGRQALGMTVILKFGTSYTSFCVFFFSEEEGRGRRGLHRKKEKVCHGIYRTT